PFERERRFIVLDRASIISLTVGFAIAVFFFSSRRRHTRFDCDWSSDVCSSDLDNRPGIILTAPIDRTLTNRPTTSVIGQLLSAVSGARVTVNGSELAVDPLGVFRKNDFALLEGDNAITAAIAGTSKSVTVHVLADFTPPVLSVRANGVALAAGARFATTPTIAVTADDANPNVTTRVTIDAAAGTDPPTL